MSLFRAAILKEASRRYKQLKELGSVASISPTPLVFLVRIIDELDIKSHDIVYELGSGDGRWIKHLSLKYSCICFGIEIDEERLQVTRTQIIDDAAKNIFYSVELIRSNFLSISLHKASVVIFYLSKEGNEKVKAKIIDECLPATIILAVGVNK